MSTAKPDMVYGSLDVEYNRVYKVYQNKGLVWKLDERIYLLNKHFSLKWLYLHDYWGDRHASYLLRRALVSTTWKAPHIRSSNKASSKDSCTKSLLFSITFSIFSTFIESTDEFDGSKDVQMYSVYEWIKKSV